MHTPQTLFRSVAIAQLTLASLVPVSAQAQLLQILHTNDLHSHFDEAEDRSLAGLEPPHAPMGGYAQVKAKIDSLKAQAAAQGIESLVLDAGDFTEGTENFFTDQGREAWRLMNIMGYDAVTLGNHDYLMGQNDLDKIVGDVQPTFPLLAANFIHSKSLKNLNHYMKPYVELERAGVKIGILGLTTDDFVYKWRAGSNVIIAPRRSFGAYIDDLEKRDDYVILLTHLGVSADQTLIKETNGVDLVVGGHSHTFLYQPVMQNNADGTPVPIVQAGQHGQVVGRIIVDVEPGKPMVLKSYELLPVENAGPKDPYVDLAVQASHLLLDSQFGKGWLEETLGYTQVPMLRPDNGPTPWGSLVADAIKTSTNADISLDAGGLLFGDNMPAGPVTREKIFRFYPRIFNLSESHGWTIWTINARGWILRTIMEIAMDQGIIFNTSGMTYTPTKVAGLWHLDNLKINGKSLSDLEEYRIALPEGIGMAIKDISPIFEIWMHNPVDSGIPMWSAIETEFLRRGGVVPAQATPVSAPASTAKLSSR